MEDIKGIYKHKEGGYVLDFHNDEDELLHIYAGSVDNLEVKLKNFIVYCQKQIELANELLKKE